MPKVADSSEETYVAKPEATGKQKGSRTWIYVAAAAIVFLLAGFYAGSLGGLAVTGNVIASQNDVGEKVVGYINDNLVQPGTSASLVSVVDNGTLYRVVLSYMGQDSDVFTTKDGKYLLLGSMIDMDEPLSVPEAPDNGAPATGVATSEVPEVELFVMSHCPYGTQIEKGILPVVELLGNKIDFKVKFVYYAMHGKTEIDEETNQYCIQKEQNAKYLSYLSCFLREGNGAGCLDETGIDKAKLSACVAAADNEFSITANFDDQSSWLSGRYPKFDVDLADNQKYGVGGSPTLVINGQQASSGRDSASLLAAICSAFDTPPVECSTALSNVSPAPGFGYEGSGSATEATCG